MKKIIILVVLFSFISCSSSNEDLIDPVVGLWKLKSLTIAGQETINDCKLKDQVEIRSDKTFTIILHSESGCVEQSSSGSWVSDSGNKYKFTAAGDTQIFTLVSDENLSFSFDLNTQIVLYTYKKQ
ncbi:lipocalin family protein [Polaribacter gochangensis]|uniref:lipocalin family protein n=1 Tax=Polaribacter gochangensis TaxID=3252903 RepID=UPI003904AFCE